MIPAVVVVVLFAAQDASDPSARAVVSTAEGALAQGTLVVVREGGETLTEDEALRVENSLRADATAIVTWTDAEHLTARIRLHLRDRSRWVDRAVAFRVGDAPSERGRTLGFALATMVQGTPHDASDGTSAIPYEPAVPPPTSRQTRFELGAFGAMGVGIAGRATGLGATIDARWRGLSTLWLRGGGSIRLGSAPEVDASSRAVKLDAGAAWHPLQFGSAAVGPRLDLGAVEHRLARTIPSGADSSAEKWIPVATLQLELRWLVTSGFVVGGAAGIEAAMGTTRVLLDGAPVSSIPPLRVVAEVGVGMRF
jgi:hypothetical protein